jgi:glutathionyl-hydroquinone reductase
VRKLKGLEDIVGFTSVHWHMGAQGEASSCCLFRFCLENEIFG